MKLKVTTWDDISGDQAERIIEVPEEGITIDTDTMMIAEAVNQAFEEAITGEDGDDYTVIKAAGSLASGAAWFEEEGRSESVLIWVKAS